MWKIRRRLNMLLMSLTNVLLSILDLLWGFVEESREIWLIQEGLFHRSWLRVSHQVWIWNNQETGRWQILNQPVACWLEKYQQNSLIWMWEVLVMFANNLVLCIENLNFSVLTHKDIFKTVWVKYLIGFQWKIALKSLKM